jgi:hypothetical protein
MIGVTAFGLIFTPVFYVLCRWLARRFAGETARATPATGTPAPLASGGPLGQA